MLFHLLSLGLLAALGNVVDAAPVEHNAKRAVTALSSTELASFAPFTQFARAAYCPTSKLQGWKCGGTASLFVSLAYFVGFWPAQSTVVVAHEGTDPTKFVSLLTDANILTDPLDKTLFPGVPSNVWVHDGFRNAHALTATKILAEVKRLLAANNAKKVALVGHSLGGALAELDALYMTLNLPSDIAIKAMTFGTPRVGNDAFAALIDSKVPDFKRINNEKDLIPIVPGRFLGFAHPHGEVHIVSPGNAVSCPGNDATDAQCQIQTVPNIFVGNILDHLGPYEGISIGTIFCT
ncbi:hypothetical protein ONZ45_g1007 [Pleurotus djamor]|nr:hypothetical protein ONZ45_g1007 [Pleurotus djamor]